MKTIWRRHGDSKRPILPAARPKNKGIEKKKKKKKRFSILARLTFRAEQVNATVCAKYRFAKVAIDAKAAIDNGNNCHSQLSCRVILLRSDDEPNQGAMRFTILHCPFLAREKISLQSQAKPHSLNNEKGQTMEHGLWKKFTSRWMLRWD